MLYTILSRIDRRLIRALFRLSVVSAEHIPSAGPLVVVANHDSLLDGFVVAAALPRRRLTFLAASYLFDMAVVGWFMRAIRALPVKAGTNNFASLRAAIEVLEEGGTIVVFPEGGTLGSGMLGGAVYLAAKTGTPVLPLRISGTREALPPGRLWPSFVRIEVRVGRAFAVSPAEAGNAGLKRAVAEGRHMLEEALRQ